VHVAIKRQIAHTLMGNLSDCGSIGAPQCRMDFAPMNENARSALECGREAAAFLPLPLANW